MTAPSFYIKPLFAGDRGNLSILLYKTFLYLLGIVATILSFYIKSVLLAGGGGDCSVLLLYKGIYLSQSRNQ